MPAEKQPPAETQRGWGLSEKIGIATLVVAILGLVAAWMTVPEFRNWVRLDNKVSGADTAPHPEALEASTRGEPMGNASPSTGMPAEPQGSVPKNQPNKGAGKSEAGTTAAVGGVTAAPCSSVQIGGAGNQSTVNCTLHQRVLNKAQHDAFVKELRVAGRVPITIACYSADAEGCRYAQSFFDVFADAGWDCGQQVEVRFDVPSDSVVRIGLREKDAKPRGMHELIAALKAANVMPHGLIQADAKDNLELVVGMNKPR